MEFDRFIIGENLKADTKIYRYMSLKQFMYFIEYNKTYFTRISSWDDTWEAPISKIPAQFDEGNLNFSGYSSSLDLFAQCWTGKEESDAMWRIYSSSKDGIKVGTTVKKLELLQGLNHCAVDRVYYYKNLMEGLNYPRNLKFPIRMFGDGLIKRDAFEHEDEIRVITSNDRRMLDNPLNDKENYLELSLNAKDFIDEVIIDPRAEEYYVDTIKSYCKRAGLELIPKKSDLYSSDIFEKTGIIQKFITKK